MSWLSAVSTILLPVAGTRLTQTKMFIGTPAWAPKPRPYAFMREFSGSNTGVVLATATSPGYCSPMYPTAGGLPPWAGWGGKYAYRIYLPTDGPEPALVTYEPRPQRSTSRWPSRVRMGSRPCG